MKRSKQANRLKINLKEENNDLMFAYTAAKAAEEKKGEKVLLLDVSRLTVVADYFLIISAKSTPQIQALANHIEERLTKFNYQMISKEGFIDSNWIVLDFGNLVVHIMHERERDYYKLERFWSNAVLIDNKAWKKAS
ncbi:MAG: ribosome silencing factor [Candidatus Melainabacteria bacterium]|nr:ribosome silencing factor [Candidatus Melainabacteria bacterium]